MNSLNKFLKVLAVSIGAAIFLSNCSSSEKNNARSSNLSQIDLVKNNFGIDLKKITKEYKKDNEMALISYASGWILGRKVLQQEATLDADLVLQSYFDAIDGNSLPNNVLQERIYAIRRNRLTTESTIEYAGLIGQYFGNEDFTSFKYDLIDRGHFSLGYKAFASQNSKYKENLDSVYTTNRKLYNEFIGKRFLEENAKREGVITTASGLQYEIILDSDSLKPQSKSTKLEAHYTGRLVDGKVFDDSSQRMTPLNFAVGNVIEGWQEGLMLMGVGAKYRFFIPYELGYGSLGAGAQIPPYSTLIFDVELLRILKL